MESNAMQTFDPFLHVFEATFTSSHQYTDSIRDVSLSVTFSGPGGAQVTVPAFWDGGQTWRVRFSPPTAGEWGYVTHVSDANNTGLHGQTGVFSAPAYTGDLPLLCHGRIRCFPGDLAVFSRDGLAALVDKIQWQWF